MNQVCANFSQNEILKAIQILSSYFKYNYDTVFPDDNFITSISKLLFRKRKLIEELRQGLNITLLNKSITQVIMYKSNADKDFQEKISSYLELLFGDEKDKTKTFLCIKDGIKVDIYIISKMDFFEKQQNNLVFSNHNFVALNNCIRINILQEENIKMQNIVTHHIISRKEN